MQNQLHKSETKNQSFKSQQYANQNLKCQKYKHQLQYQKTKNQSFQSEQYQNQNLEKQK